MTPATGSIAIGLLRVRGNESGAVTESELGTICRFENGKVTLVRTLPRL